MTEYDGTQEKTCPKCGITGSIDEKFGFRGSFETIRPQSYCRACRSNKKPKKRTTYANSVFPPIGLTRPVLGEVSTASGAINLVKQQMTVIELRQRYCAAYPKDKEGPRRSFNFMAKKMAKKLGPVVRYEA